MAGFFVILAASLVLAALYITGSIKPPLRAKAAASLAFVVLGLYTLIAPGGRVWAAPSTGPGIDLFRLLLFCGLCCGALGHVLYVAAFFRVDGPAAWIGLLCAFPMAAILTVLSARMLTFQGARRLILLTYMLALSFMCAFAWVILIRRGAAPFRLIAPGGTLFLLSDSALGMQMFGNEDLAKHRRLLGTICLITYYLAQNLIAASMAF
ncbi:MAG: hypothetical protein II184_03400 [Clostridia bacterium]|nr:hypothetical protein [Clostridia bacterium]